MNRNCYRLVYKASLGMFVPQAECTRARGKSPGNVTLATVVLAGSLGFAPLLRAELPVASGTFVTHGQAAVQAMGSQMNINQVGDKSILNWQSFNVSAGNSVQFRQVDNLTSGNLVQGASFTSLNRIHDFNPSVIAGAITQAAGQKANVILVNSNGIAFMGGAQVNLNSFTASTLNIKDEFITGSFLTNSTTTPQFENALDGSAGKGFIKVFNDARISATDSGRVMLIAPTVVNKGTVTAEGGQVIAAAGSKVYLRSASGQDSNVRGLLVEVDSNALLTGFDQANPDVRDGVLDGVGVSLINAAEDKLGHVTNSGTIETRRGNTTMIGYVVNQQGVARATSAVQENGTVYLLAKDRAQNSSQSLRAGQVVLASGSRTEVGIESSGGSTTDGSTGEGLAIPSRVNVLGLDVRMESGAAIVAPSGVVEITAMENPGVEASANPFTNPGASFNSASARVHIADGARISVAGLENVAVDVARNQVELELRGDELKDSPLNQSGALRGKTVHVDVRKMLDRAEAGEDTLIARDSLESYNSKLERSAQERATGGGTVSVRSQGEAILESGAVVDLSGGSVQYTAGFVKTTTLSTGGQLVDIADANAGIRYDGIANSYTVDYGRWNRQETLESASTYRYTPGYTQGKDAGTLSVVGMRATVMQADVQGRTVTGERQQAVTEQPRGATLVLGSAALSEDYKLNQEVVIGRQAALLDPGFAFGDVLPAAQLATLELNAALMGKDKVAHLEVYNNQAVTVRDALRLPDEGSLTVKGRGVQVLAGVTAHGGKIELGARDALGSGVADLQVASGVQLDVSGVWNNLLPNQGSSATSPLRPIDGGTVNLSATGALILGNGSVIDVQGGAAVSHANQISLGDGGDVALSGALQLGGDILGYAPGAGGTLTLNTPKMKVGGPVDATAFHLDTGLLDQGFTSYVLKGSESLEVTDGTVLRPRVVSRVLNSNYSVAATGSDLSAFTSVYLADELLRDAANLTLAADGSGATDGTLRIGTGARIEADAGATVQLQARNGMEVQGLIQARGGDITLSVTRNASDNYDPGASLWLGSGSVLDASGVAQTTTDGNGRVQGRVLDGGTVTLAATNAGIVSQQGSRIVLDGSPAVTLDLPNEQGGLGRSVASDGGKLVVRTTDAALLDGAASAHAGGPGQRGGRFDIELQPVATGDGVRPNYPINDRVLIVQQSTGPQAAGLQYGNALPLASNGNVRLSADALRSAGFDELNLASHHAIRLDGGVQVGAAGSLPLRSLTLDAGRIETTGGNVGLSAHAVTLGNKQNTAGGVAAAGTGSLTLDGALVTVAGRVTVSGTGQLALRADEAVRLSGAVDGANVGNTGSLVLAAQLTVDSPLTAPATDVDFTIAAPGQRVEFINSSGAAALTPYSVQGSVTVQAREISQGSTLHAPFGQINLQASEGLEFRAGSVTSVSGAGTLFSYGRVENGRSWVSGVEGADTTVSTLEGKALRASGQTIAMQAGAVVDLSGGGDLQAHEFTVGPGGSADILAKSGMYAVLPGYASGFAPSDGQEAFGARVGTTVYLSGVPGLAAGTYTLLPAHYALLPGAYAVRLETGLSKVLPNQSYARADGVWVSSGYLSDSRAGAPRDSAWQGIEVLSREQVRARSEFTLTRASDFFADGAGRTADAGLLSISTTGTGASALALDATYRMAAASGGQGAAVDLAASQLAITGPGATGVDPNAVQVTVEELQRLGAASLLLGGTRTSSGTQTTLTTVASQVTLTNDEQSALRGPEVMLMARDQITLAPGSVIDAQGATAAATSYATTGDGAFVRAATSQASFVRGGTAGATGRIVATAGPGEAAAVIRAARAITLDATQDNAFKGQTVFEKDGAAVAGALAVGASRINFVGDSSAATGLSGISYKQQALDDMSALESLTLTSYSSFDLYGDVQVGGRDLTGSPTLKSLTLQGAGLRGLDNAGQTASVNAQQLNLNNAGGAALPADGAALGSGALDVRADVLTLGAGNRTIGGFAVVQAQTNEIKGVGTGSTVVVGAPLTVLTQQISGAALSSQSLSSGGALTVRDYAPEEAAPVQRTVTAAPTLGAEWTLQGSSVNLDTAAHLHAGEMTITATGGDVRLGSRAVVDVSGRRVDFFDVQQAADAGRVTLAATGGGVVIAGGANVNVSGTAGSNAGELVLQAAGGQVSVARGTVQGQTPADPRGRSGEGARVAVDTGTLASYSDLNDALNDGGFAGARNVRVRSGGISVASGDVTRAQSITLTADNGAISIAGELDASGTQGGRAVVQASGDVDVLSGARLAAVSSAAGAKGGQVEVSTRAGTLDFAAGSTVDVSAGTGGAGGELLLRAPRVGNDVGVGVLGATVTGAARVDVEAVRTYNFAGDMTLNSGATETATILGLGKINSDNTAYAVNHAAITSRLGQTGNSSFRVVEGVEVRSAGNITLGADWNLAGSRPGGNAGQLTLRSAGNLNLNNNLSDGFNVATPLNGANPATLLSDDSWGYRLVAGADTASADVMAVNAAGTGSVTVAAGKLVRTGTGDIRFAAGRDVVLASNTSVVYTAGKAAPALAGFTTPSNAQFSAGGGDLELSARGNISGARSTQLYSNWLFRQGRLDATGAAYTTQPAWWVRFDQFQQGVATLGGGNVTVRSGGNVSNLSASAATQARTSGSSVASAALAKTGGGSVRIDAAGDVLGGQFYADGSQADGQVLLQAQGKLGAGTKVGSNDLYPVIALGDAQARVNARGDVQVHAVINPHLVVQSRGTNYNLSGPVPQQNANNALWTLFSSYSDDSAVSLASLAGSVKLFEQVGSSASGGLAPMTSTSTSTGPYANAGTAILNFGFVGAGGGNPLGLLPSNVSLISFQQDALLAGSGVIQASATGQLQVLAGGHVSLPGTTRLADSPASNPLAPSATNTIVGMGRRDHALVPVHAGDVEPVRIYAVEGSVSGTANSVALESAKAVRVKAGQDVVDLGLTIQHANAGDVSHIGAGRDILFSTDDERSKGAYVWIGGPGRLEMTAGRHIDLGTSAGVVSRGNLDNSALPTRGADLELAAGLGRTAGIYNIDNAAVLARLISRLQAAAGDETALWHARWLTGNAGLDEDTALPAVQAVAAADPAMQRSQVRELLASALRTTGRDANNAQSPYAGSYDRAYAALDLIFPDSGAGTAAAAAGRTGDINLFASRILTEAGGRIDLMAPSGSLVVGLSNTPAALLQTETLNPSGNGQTDTGVLGIVAMGEGDVQGVTRDDMLVNQSRILTVGGGDILLWSSSGDIDAGKGKKSAAVVPPPLTLVKADGSVTRVLQGAATGSGIGALEPVGSTPGDVDLIAPRGTVNAGDAGIRAGNLNIAAQVVLGAENIKVSGSSSGTPVVDNSAVNASSSGATSRGEDAAQSVAAASQAASEAARNAQALANQFKPAIVRVDLLGFGE